MDKVAAFCIGNAVGLTILFTGIMVSAPKKMKESAELQKQAAPIAAEHVVSKTEEAANDVPKRVSGNESGISAMQSQVAQVQTESKSFTTPNIVAATNIAKDSVITSAMLRVNTTFEATDTHNKTDGSDADEDALRKARFTGRRAKVDIKKNALVTPEMIQ